MKLSKEEKLQILQNSIEKGYHVYSDTVFNSILPSCFGYSIENVYNTYSQIDMTKEYFEKEHVLTRGIEIGYTSLKIKIENEIVKKINFDHIETLKITPSYLYCAHSDTNIPRQLKGISCLPEICLEKMIEIEDNLGKRVGIQVFDIDYILSDKILVKKIREDKDRIRIGFSAFFDLVSIKANVFTL